MAVIVYWHLLAVTAGWLKITLENTISRLQIITLQVTGQKRMRWYVNPVRWEFPFLI